MNDSRLLDDQDLQLLHALQFSPRASWQSLGRVLELDSSTLSRRWQAMTSAGLAWVSAYPTPRGPWGSLAFVEVSCTPGRREEVVGVLQPMDAVWTIECTTGTRDLFLTVGMASLEELDTFVSEQIASIPAVSRTRTHFSRVFYREGSSWRLNALNPLQRQALSGLARATIPQPSTDPSEYERALVHTLACDGRRSASSIAQALDRSLSGVTRGIERLFASGQARIRCEVAHNTAGWRASVALLLSVRQDLLPALAHSLSALPQMRMCASIVSASNLLCQLWMNRIEELDYVEAYLAERCPTARVDDRWMTSRFAKRVGHLIDPDGRRTGCVPPAFAVSDANSR
jgi:DNA-binding Lrp family transcriptional regulator